MDFLPVGKKRQTVKTFITVQTFIGNVFLFFLIMAALALFFYGIGTVQYFAESTLLILLRILYWNGAILIIFMILSALLSAGIFITRGVRYKTNPAWAILSHLLFGIAGLLLMLFAGGILTFAEGHNV